MSNWKDVVESVTFHVLYSRGCSVAMIVFVVFIGIMVFVVRR